MCLCKICLTAIFFLLHVFLASKPTSSLFCFCAAGSISDKKLLQTAVNNVAQDLDVFSRLNWLKGMWNPIDNIAVCLDKADLTFARIS